MSLPGPVTMVFKAVEGITIECDVWLPDLTHGESILPAVVWYHGGGGFVGDKGPDKSQWFRGWVKDLVTKRNKWIFISPNYRLLVPSTAHDMIEDVQAMFTYIEREFAKRPILSVGEQSWKVDTKRIVVGGESFGGYCARLACLHAMPKPIGMVSLYGMGGHYLTPWYLAGRTPDGPLSMPLKSPIMDTSDPNITSLFKSTEPIASTIGGLTPDGQPLHPRQSMFRISLQLGNFLDYLTGIQGLSAKLKDGRGDYHDSSVPQSAYPVLPQLLIDASFPPSFFIHGTSDTAVSIEESRQTASQLTQFGVKNESIEVEGAEHGFDSEVKLEDGNAMFNKVKRVEQWLQELLK